MERFVVRPDGPLHGEVRAGGAKNSALKLMAATLLAPGDYTIRNVPRIIDVETMSDLLVSMGVDVRRPAADTLAIHTPDDCVPEAPYELVEQMRASIVVLGPLVARFGRAKVAMPGGDDFGSRPIDMHLQGLEMLGVRFSMEHGYIQARAEMLIGTRVLLEFPSVGATENLLMAAVLAKGETVIDNAAREPEIADLAAMLVAMGARIDGAGTSMITVEGVDELHGCEHDVVPDRIEAATFLAAAGLAGGQITVVGARAEHMEMPLTKLADMGMDITTAPGSISARVEGRLRSIDVSTLPYPGVATDYKPLFVALLTVADGVGIVTENVYGANRYAYVAELARMGADIRTEGHHAVVRGVPRLSGAPVKAPDIRAGAALVVAGLAAEGETIVSGTQHLDRGYEDFAGKLRGIGANVTRLRSD